MTTLVYDGSFAGFLSAVFEVYNGKWKDVSICKTEFLNQSLFGDTIQVTTNEQQSARVWKGLSQKLSVKGRQQLYHSFLSEQKGMEDVMLRYIQHAFSSKAYIETDYNHPDVMTVAQTSQKVRREKHRMEAFVRFQKMKDDLYFAQVQPDFNVLPLIAKHFKDRYADQRWMIYDVQRKYGIYYDLQKVEEVNFVFAEAAEEGKNIAFAYDEKEELYQLAWKQYFSSVNIAPRKNMKLHIQHMPKRYWKHLVEKQ